MLKIEKTVLPSPEQWEIIIEGMRNPMNSWDNMDSEFLHTDPYGGELPYEYSIGDNDHKLMSSLANGGPVHAKYRRMIPVYLTINAPLYWWKEYDTYKIGTVANSCSTMHKIHSKEFVVADFSTEHLIRDWTDDKVESFAEIHNPCNYSETAMFSPFEILRATINVLNVNREAYLETKDKKYWEQMIQLLPTSYNQKRTVMLNYEVLVNIYHSRKNHKLDEWHVFCDWIEKLPYSDLIIN